MRQVLDGLKVADFTWYAAGPYVTRYLALFGAKVVKIETSARPDGTRTIAPYKDGKPGLNRSGGFAFFNPNKHGVTLNLKHPRGTEVAKRIVAWADVVADNFATGRMQEMGLGYEALRKIKPDLIVLSSTNQGQTGPHARQPGFGIQLECLSGFVHLIGWPDRGPVVHSGLLTDLIAARFAVVAILGALDYRRRTGKGQYIDLSQYQCGLQFLAPLLLDFKLNGRVADRVGNRCPSAAPCGVYPCRGDDRWCAISVLDDIQWRGLTQAMGEPSWAGEPRFSMLLTRKENEDELDSLLGEWTSNFVVEEVAMLLQRHNVPAGVVKNSQDIYHDPQLAHRQQWKDLPHSELGSHRGDYPGFILSKTPGELKTSAPLLGQDNEYFYTKLLGMSDEEFLDLLNSGALQ